ncbi:MAG: hypothetical protein FWF95_08005 [Syntrophorhabdaceae bacterium]|nr:hypothetical protein [Syntrophorhabdaceae bacterium]
MVLLTIGLFLLLMVQMTSVSTKSQSISSRKRMAVEAGQSKMDLLCKYPWDLIRSSSDEGFVEENGSVMPAVSRLPGGAGDSVSIGGTKYYRFWRVVPDPEIQHLKTITVWCFWKSEGGLWRHTALVTQLADVEHSPE